MFFYGFGSVPQGIAVGVLRRGVGRQHDFGVDDFAFMGFEIKSLAFRPFIWIKVETMILMMLNNAYRLEMSGKDRRMMNPVNP